MKILLAAHDEWLRSTNHLTVLPAVPAMSPRAAAVTPREVIKGYYRDEAEQFLAPFRKFFKQKGPEATFIGKVGNVPT